MKHLGDITKISGRTAPVVDVVIGGSPCQDLSIAGRRAGLAGARSGLFMEQIRIVREMREEDRRSGRTGSLIRPRFMVWENVPGAFSSNKGEDFRAVLEEVIRIAEPDAPDVPLPPKGRWPLADAYYGDGWSLAYRVLDAQFWGVPQRRRRIALVADFGGHAAPEILFERKGVSGDTDESEPPREAAPAVAGAGADLAVKPQALDCNGGAPTSQQGGGCIVQPVICMASAQAKAEVLEDVCPTLMAGCEHPIVLTFPDGVANTLLNKANLSHQADKDTLVLQIYENHGQDSRLTGPLEIAPTVAQKFGTGGNNTPLVLAVDCRNGTINDINGTLQAKSSGGQSLNLNNVVFIAVPSEPVSFDLAQVTSPTNQSKGSVGTAYSLASTGRPAVITTTEDGIVILDGQPCTVVRLLVRRLTPLECERLQGYPDGWTDIGPWVDSKGKAHKESNDSARYMALGNSIALPPWKWVLKRISAQYERDATMASLFDGIGGFPLLWEQINGPGSCLWASEIEKFPIAVTRCRFKDEAP